MRTILSIIFAVSVAPAIAGEGFSTVDQYQPDFATATECDRIDNRRVWAGKEAYYIQANALYSSESGLLDDEYASAVPLADNTADALSVFAEACD